MLCQWDVKHDGLASPPEVVVPWSSRYHDTHYILNTNFPLRKRDTFLILTELDYFFPCISNTVKVSANSHRQGVQTLRHLVSYIVLQKDFAEET